VAIEAIRDELTVAQIVAKHGIHQTLVNGWKKQALEPYCAVAAIAFFGQKVCFVCPFEMVLAFAILLRAARSSGLFSRSRPSRAFTRPGPLRTAQ
jgi:hypothetical protein